MKNSGIHTNRGAADPGFSLIECMLVLMCAAILIAAAIPGIARMQCEWTLWTAARMVECSLQWGRMHAISSNSSTLFTIDSDKQTFCWMDPGSGQPYAQTSNRLPGKTWFASFPKSALRFYQHGNAAPAGTYKVQGEAGSYSVIVSPGGRIRIQKN